MDLPRILAPDPRLAMISSVQGDLRILKYDMIGEVPRPNSVGRLSSEGQPLDQDNNPYLGTMI